MANPTKVAVLQRFFKTGKGEYGEGDIFLGINIPDIRKIAAKSIDIELKEIKKLLESKIHEERMIAIIILTDRYRLEKEKRQEIYDFYLANTKFINNWDLVDVSAHKIIGDFLDGKDRSILYKLAKSENLWERRISIISTFAFIRHKQFKDSFKISEMLLSDKHDLIHKAVGWMLREVGKKDEKLLEEFLKKNYKEMPRTMLRYAIEKFPEKRRKEYLNGLV